MRLRPEPMADENSVYKIRGGLTGCWGSQVSVSPARRAASGQDSAASPLGGCILSSMAARIAGFRGEFLWELEIAERQIVSIAECTPAEQYDWRPVAQARSFSEVFVHVATGNFMLLDVIGVAAPVDLYAQVPSDGDARFRGLIWVEGRYAGPNTIVPLTVTA